MVIPPCAVSVTRSPVINVKVIVPDGVAVEMTGHCVMGDRKVLVRETRGGPRVPVVHVRANVVMGDVKIVDDEHHAPVRRALASCWERRNQRN